MPYPVLPPPPPPVVNSVVSNQGEYAAPVMPQDTSALDQQSDRPPSSVTLNLSVTPASLNAQVSQAPQASIAASALVTPPPTAVLGQPVRQLPLVDWSSCLANHGQLGLASSELVSAIRDASPCPPSPQPEARSPQFSLPVVNSDKAESAALSGHEFPVDEHSANASVVDVEISTVDPFSVNNHGVLPASDPPTPLPFTALNPVETQLTGGSATGIIPVIVPTVPASTAIAPSEINSGIVSTPPPSMSVASTGISPVIFPRSPASAAIVPLPTGLESVPQNVELAEDIYYIFDTFSPAQFVWPSLQQIVQQQPGPTRDITAISIDTGSASPAQVETIWPRPTTHSTPIPPLVPTIDPEEISGLVPLLNVDIATGSPPIPPFVPTVEPGAIAGLTTLIAQESGLNEGTVIDDESILENVPSLDRIPPIEIEVVPPIAPREADNEEPNQPLPNPETNPGARELGAEDVGPEDANPENVGPGDAGTEDGSPNQTRRRPVNPNGDVLDTSRGDILEVTADRQVYDQKRQSFEAEGNALMTFRGTLLQADRLRVNLQNRVVVAQGNAVLTRGDQVLRGERLEYNLIQDQGTVSKARGEVYLPQTSTDLSTTEQPDLLSTELELPLAERLANQQPVVTATSAGGLTFGGTVSGGQGSSSDDGTLTSGTVSRIRFEADAISFTSDGWQATNVRLTNDPFSPPELEVRSRLVTFRRLDETRSELRARRPRLVLDQGLQIPLFRDRAIFGRDSNPAPFNIGFDNDDRGGLFIERAVDLIVTDDVEFTLTPQFFLQRALENSDGTDQTPPDLEDTNSILDPDLYGLLGRLNVDFDARTSLSAGMELTSFDLADAVDDSLRGSVRLSREIATGLGPHELTTEYSYRDRLFNGTLGFQTIQKSYGFVITSPTIRLGDSDVLLTYQGGIQRINANIASERFDDLLPPFPRDNNRLTLNRYQLAARLSRFTFLWRGRPLPSTADQGLRYTPVPVVPYIAVIPSVQGVASFYSSGDTQPVLTGSLSLLGQFGHFSRPFLDFLGFNVTYRRSTEGPESPFLFDRVNDREVVSGGVTVQLFGPVRVGFQTSISLSEEREFDNSFILEYSRRTHGIIFRYNPDREQGGINIRFSDFNWTGTPEPFGGNPDDPTPLPLYD